jgi:chemotaxis protein MotA
MFRFDLNSFLGLFIALACVVGGVIHEGGRAESLLQVTAFIIVFGGTVGAVMLQTPFKTFWTGIKMFAWVFVPPRYVSQELINQITEWGITARKDGFLKLDSNAQEIDNPFMRKGLQLLVDGIAADKIKETLDVEINAFEHFNRQAIRIWEAAGGYAPTLGILGAVVGLIHVMENLSDPSKLGSGVAVAFVATIYGVGLANLVFLPVFNKLKTIVNHHVVWREMLVDGLMAIANGENPRVIKEKLLGYIV